MNVLKTSAKKLASNKRWRQRNTAAVAYHKRNARLRRFGLEPDDLDAMLVSQDFKCACCDDGPLLREGKGQWSAHIDHCHTSGNVRGLVCKRCNALLGFIESDLRKFGLAMEYLIDRPFRSERGHVV